MRIIIEVIPHKAHRTIRGELYNTCGDWFKDAAGDWRIEVSYMEDWRKEMAVAVHELVEMLICQHQGVTEAQMDAFDIKHNKPNEEDMELGDMADCPGADAHCFATAVERMLVPVLGIKWQDYDAAIEAVCE